MVRFEHPPSLPVGGRPPTTRQSSATRQCQRAVVACRDGYNTRTVITDDDCTGLHPRQAAGWDVDIFKYGDELQTTLITLERNRRTFAWKCSEVDADGLRLRLGRSDVTLGGLLKHLALCEETTFQADLRGASLLPAFRGVDHDATWETWAWESAADDDPDTLRDLWRQAVHRSRSSVAAVLTESDLDYAFDGGMSLRRMLSDQIEEYARHTGHADLLREAIDGRTGEGPPAEFPVP